MYDLLHAGSLTAPNVLLEGMFQGFLSKIPPVIPWYKYFTPGTIGHIIVKLPKLVKEKVPFKHLLANGISRPAE